MRIKLSSFLTQNSFNMRGGKLRCFVVDRNVLQFPSWVIENFLIILRVPF